MIFTGVQSDLCPVSSGYQTQKLSIDLPRQIFTLEASQQSKLGLFSNHWIFIGFCVLLLIKSKKLDFKQNSGTLGNDFHLISYNSYQARTSASFLTFKSSLPFTVCPLSVWFNWPAVRSYQDSLRKQYQPSGSARLPCPQHFSL